MHREVIETIVSFALEEGFLIRGLDHSPVKGPEGNIEYLLWIQNGAGQEMQKETTYDEVISQVVKKAHEELDK